MSFSGFLHSLCRESVKATIVTDIEICYAVFRKINDASTASDSAGNTLYTSSRFAVTDKKAGFHRNNISKLSSWGLYPLNKEDYNPHTIDDQFWGCLHDRI